MKSLTALDPLPSDLKQRMENEMAEWIKYHGENDMHKKIMKGAAKKLEADAAHYHKEAAHAKGKKKMHEKVEEKEAKSAAKDLKKRAKKAHEY